MKVSSNFRFFASRFIAAVLQVVTATVSSTSFIRSRIADTVLCCFVHCDIAVVDSWLRIIVTQSVVRSNRQSEAMCWIARGATGTVRQTCRRSTSCVTLPMMNC